MNTFGELLKWFRLRAGLDQKPLADLLRVHRNTIVAWENSQYLPRHSDMVKDLARELYLSEAETNQLLAAANYPPKYHIPHDAVSSPPSESDVNLPHILPKEIKSSNPSQFEPPQPLSEEPIVEIAEVSQDDNKDAAFALQFRRIHRSPLVGRDQELALLQKVLITTEHAMKLRLPNQKKALVFPLDTPRSTQSVLLMGEVGIGKTRLAEEMAHEARRRGWTIGWSRMYPQEANISYHPWTEVLRKVMDQVGWQSQEVSKRSFMYQPLIALLPELDSLLAQTAVPSSLYPEQVQMRLWEAIHELLTLISESTPLLIVLDDVQWADSSSCELLAYLARRLYGLPIVIVGTCRENELGSNHPLRLLLTDLQHEHAIETTMLQPLSNEQIGEIVSDVPHLPESLMQYIQTRAAGNPFFAEELARTLETTFTEVQFFTSNHLEKIISAWPDSITAALNLHLRRLSSACQRLLSKAAVLGSSFEFHLISAMEANTPGFSEETVLDLVEEALQAGILSEEGTGTRITYQFWHPLLVTHLYEGLSAARRASFHHRAAELLRQEYEEREEEGAATLTHHLIKGGMPSSQIAYSAELAGSRAYALSAYPDAERYYRLAVEHLQRTFQQISHPSLDEYLHLASLLEFLGECTSLQGKYEEARHVYQRTLEVRQQCSASSELSQEEAQIQALLWGGISLTWYNTGDTTKARHYCQRGEHVLQEAGVVGGSARASLRFQQGSIYWREGNYEQAQRSAQEALKLFEEMLTQQQENPAHFARSTRIRRTLAGDPVELGRTHVLLGLIANGAGRSHEAIEQWNAALATFELHDRHREIAVVCCNLGDVHLRRAEYRLAQAFLRRSLGIAQRIGELPLVCVIFNNLGILSARLGDLVGAESWYKKGLVLAERNDDPINRSTLYAYLTNVLQDQGKLEEAKTSVLKALSTSRALGITPCIGFALVALGSLRLAQALRLQEDEKTNTELGAGKRALKRAKRVLLHAIALEGMEAETQTEGHLLLAQVELLLDESARAHQRAVQTLEEARRYELTWLIARAHRILGTILTKLDRREEAREYFEQALQVFHKSEMRLEHARTLYEYGTALLGQSDAENQECRRSEEALHYLREASQVFTSCKASLDAQVVERLLASSEQATEK